MRSRHAVILGAKRSESTRFRHAVILGAKRRESTRSRHAVILDRREGIHVFSSCSHSRSEA